MSWIFGGKSEEKKDAEFEKSLGFSPSQVTDVSSIIQSPGGLDVSRLHPLAGLDKGVEFLDIEDERLTDVEGAQGLIPSRNWSDDICYGTGAVYLLGLGVGGLSGFRDGVKSLPANAPPRVQLNTILNSITKRGPFLGNSSAVLAFSYNVFDSILDAVREKHDDYNSVAAGAIAGALFRSGAGLKPMGYSTVMMAGAAGIWCGIKRMLA